MDGYTLTQGLTELLAESSTSVWMDSKTSFDFLYKAAIATVDRTMCLTSSQAITSVDGTSAYALNGDFLRLWLTDNQNRYFIKYYDTSNYTFIYWASYDAIYLANNTNETSIPDRFTIKDYAAISRYTGTATSAGAATNGECTLTDTAATFTNVYAGDHVHNTTDGSHGVVISKTSNTALVTCLFGGTANDWTSADAYIIIPQMRYQIIVDPTSSTSGHTITVPYVQKPTPVYSNYRAYNIAQGYELALEAYAAWLYRYKDREPNFGDKFYMVWNSECLRLSKDTNDAVNRKGYRVNLIKRATRSWSYK